jgi:hypothetical protein
VKPAESRKTGDGSLFLILIIEIGLGQKMHQPGYGNNYLSYFIDQWKYIHPPIFERKGPAFIAKLYNQMGPTRSNSAAPLQILPRVGL